MEAGALLVGTLQEEISRFLVVCKRGSPGLGVQESGRQAKRYTFPIRKRGSSRVALGRYARSDGTSVLIMFAHEPTCRRKWWRDYMAGPSGGKGQIAGSERLLLQGKV